MAYLTNLGAEPTGDVLSDAAEYVHDRWMEFLDLPRQIIDLQHRAALAAQSYREQGDEAGELAAKALIRVLGDLNQLHGRILDTYSYLAPYVGLGAIAIPVAAAAAFSALALVLLWFFRKFSIQEQALDMLEAGTLSEEGFIQMNRELGPSPLEQTTSLARLALYAALAFVVLKLVQGVGSFRENPELLILGNPEPFGSRVRYIEYEHADRPGVLYHHTFRPGVTMEADDNGTVTLRGKAGRPVWREF
jgi:hypothetical protein